MGLKLLRQKDYVARLRAAGFAKVKFAAKSSTPNPHKAKFMVVATKRK